MYLWFKMTMIPAIYHGLTSQAMMEKTTRALLLQIGMKNTNTRKTDLKERVFCHTRFPDYYLLPNANYPGVTTTFFPGDQTIPMKKPYEENYEQ